MEKEKELESMSKQNKWFWGALTGVGIGLGLIFIVMVIADPYFHYHGKIPGMKYRIYNERYINPGIMKHFEYDAIITGTSMNQNFKTSQMDSLFGTNAIKVPFSGAGFKEIRENLERAFESDNEIQYVLWGIDYVGLAKDADYVAYEDYPDYLYDNNILNDAPYVWNKEILFSGVLSNILMTLRGEETTSFDEYASWDVGRGWDFIKKTYFRSVEIQPMENGLTEEEIKTVEENIRNNIVALAKEHPETKFLLFYSPYSILYWDIIYRDGTLEKQLEAEKITSELLLECENIELYNFFDKTDIVCNLDNYQDGLHYVNDINDMIMTWIAKGEGRITKDNYKDIIEWEREYYMNYDYDAIYQY